MPLYSVKDPIDVLHVQSAVKAFALQLGFDRFACQELAIVASELASNILKYGERGEILAQVLASEHGPCLEIVATDYGPPFRDLDSALKDGWNEDGPIDPMTYLQRKGIGGGLGAIVRFTDTFAVEQDARQKQIITRRYLAANPTGGRRVRSVP